MANRNGFIPSRQPQQDWIRNVPVNALAKEVAKGDAVTLLNGNALACSAGQDPTKKGFGIVIAVYTTANRPLTFQTTKYIASGQVGRADVCYDPNQTYYVQCVTSVGGSNIGSNLIIDVSAANSQTGLSGMSVDIPASASTNDLFKLINIGPFDIVTTGGYSQGTTGGAPNNGVEVRWNNHFLNAPTAAI